MAEVDLATRDKMLREALKQFAHSGFRGASVQAIVDGAKVTKPTLYYYFASKAAIYQALVDLANDRRYALMQEAAEKGKTFEEKLVEILAATFEFLATDRDLMRLAFTIAFAAPGELPPQTKFLDKSRRNFDFVQSLIRQEIETGNLDRQFEVEELACGFYGLLNIYVMGQLVVPDAPPLTRKKAERIVALFLKGAGLCH